jgi:hypothetical protein
LDPLCILLVLDICVLQPPIATSVETTSASEVFSKGLVVKTCWCVLGAELWVCPCANTVQGFTKEFRKKDLALNIPLDSYETLMKYFGTLHSYICHTLIMFYPNSIENICVQATHLENTGKHVQEDPTKKPSNFLLIFQNPNPVSVSLIFQSNLNANLSFSTVSAYVTAWCFSIYSAWCFNIYSAWCFSIYSQWCFSICYSLVFQHILSLVFQHILSPVFQHILQPGVSPYTTAWCFSIY